jgi:hypothetical protein
MIFSVNGIITSKKNRCGKRKEKAEFLFFRLSAKLERIKNRQGVKPRWD